MTPLILLPNNAGTVECVYVTGNGVVKLDAAELVSLLALADACIADQDAEDEYSQAQDDAGFETINDDFALHNLNELYDRVEEAEDARHLALVEYRRHGVAARRAS